MRRTATLLAALTLGAVACASEPDPVAGSGRLEAVAAGTLEFAEWLVPLAAGTSVVEYAAVPAENRRGKVVTLEPELTIGGELSDPRSAFFHASDVAVDAAGRMYISDSGNYRVQVFEADGTFVRSLGGRGQGPGELEGPRELEVTHDRVLVWDGRRRRLITWDLEGNPAEDIHLEGVSGVREMELAGDASLVVLHSRLSRGPDGELRPGARQDYLIQSFSLDGTPEVTYLEFPSAWLSQGPMPEFAVSGSGTVYVSTTKEYQVHAFPRDGSPWALRVNWQRRSTDEQIERFRNFMEQYPGGAPASIQQGPDDFGYGELQSAIVGIRVDGHGHVYVAVNLSIDERRALQLHPETLPFGVDVYSPQGQHLFSGLLDGGLWDAAAGDYVYDVGYDDAGEQTLVRKLIREPF